MTTSTRRAVLAGAAALPALAVPAAASAAAPCSYPDLQSRYEDIYSRWQALCAHDKARSDHFQAILARYTGKPLGWRPWKNGECDDAVRQQFDEAFKLACAEHKAVMPDDDPDCTRWDAMWDEKRDLLDDVFSRPALTPADVALSLQVYALYNYPVWIEASEADDELQTVFANVAKLCGATILPGVEFVKHRGWQEDDQEEEAA